jgi:hypothetical protein
MPTGWLSRIDIAPSEFLHADQLNSLGLDIRNWGGDVNGGGHVLSNVILSGSGGFQYSPSPHEITPGSDGRTVVQLDQSGTPNPIARWTVGKDATAESGSNAGSNFAITRYSDAGAVLGTPISINRATGLITMGQQFWSGPVNANGQTLSNVVIPGMLSDPTTTKGDLLVRSVSALTRLGVGADGQVLTADSTQAGGVKWAAVVTGVASVFGRTGAVVAQAGDYTAAQVTNAVSTTGSYADPTWITSLAYGKITGAPPAGVPSTRQIIAGAGLTGGGDLSADRTLTAVPMGPSGAGHAAGIVPDPGATAGATRFLREDATWSVPAGGSGGSGSVAGSSGQVQFNSSGAFGASSNFFWDNANVRLGIGTSTPGYQSLPGRTTVTIKGQTEIGALELANGTADGNNAVGQIQWVDVNATSSNKNVAQILVNLNGTTANNRGADLSFITKPDNGNGGLERMRITNVGNVGIGTADPTLGITYNANAKVVGILGPATTQFDVAVLALGTNHSSPVSGSIIGCIDFDSPTNPGGSTAVARMWGELDGSGGTNGFGGRLRFLLKGDNGTSSVERMRITSAGYVGIGTTGPLGLLDLSGPNVSFIGQFRIAAPDIAQITFYNSAAPAAGSANMKGQIYYNVPSNLLVLNNFNSGSFGPISLNSSGGNVGIGTTVIPLYTATPAAGRTTFSIKGTTDAGIIELAQGAPDATGQLVGALGWTDMGNTQADKRAGQINVVTSGATANNRGTAMIFYARPDASPNMLERMRIDQSGNVGIGTAGPTTPLHILGPGTTTLTVENASSTVGSALVSLLGDLSPQLVTQLFSSCGLALGGVGTGSNHPFTIRTNSLDRVRIDTSGNVGINTTTPGCRLEVCSATSGGPAMSGAVQANGTLRVGTTGVNNCIDFGCYGASPYGVWMQGNDRSNLATSYPIVLQPNFGSVVIGTPQGGTANTNTDGLTINTLGPSGYGQLRFIYSTSGYGAFFRSDGSALYLMVTASNDVYGTWRSNWPLQVTFSSQLVTINSGLVVNGGLTVPNGGMSVQSGNLSVTGNVNVTGQYQVNGVPLATGGVTVQNVVTGSRSIGTNYQNTTGKPMFVAASIQCNTVGALLAAYTDATTSPTTGVTCLHIVNTGQALCLTFWVLPGNYYRLALSAGSPTIVLWTEWN